MQSEHIASESQVDLSPLRDRATILEASRRSIPLLLPLLVGTLLRFLWVRGHFHVLMSDEIPYNALATQIAAGQPYGLPFWPPGYPLVLSMVYRAAGPQVAGGIWFNFVISVLTIIFLGAITNQLFGRRAAALSLWIIALMPSYILPIALLRYEVWMQFLLLLGLWFALRGPWTGGRVAATASITALLTLMRPFWIVLPVLLWLCTRLSLKVPVKKSTLLVAQGLSIALIVPWLWYASSEAGRFVLVGMNGGMNLWMGNNPHATGRYMPLAEEFWTAEYDSQAQGMAVDYILHHPGHVLRLLPFKLWYSLDHEPWAEWVFGATTTTFPPETPRRVLALMNVSYWLVSSLSLASIVILHRSGRYDLLVPLILLGFSVASQLPFWGSVRFRWVAQFLIIMYAASLPSLMRAREASPSRQVTRQ